LTATREIRKDARFKNLPIIAMTANAMTSDCDLCIEAGMNDYVAKPIDPELLFAALLKWIKPDELAVLAEQRPGAIDEAEALQLHGIEHIAGLDVRLGLMRVLGKQPLYVSMLKKFVAGQKNATAQMTEALDAQDWNAAELYAHTLKGVAGNIGAGPLQEQAECLETAIMEKHPRESIDRQVALLSALLSALIGQLEANLPEEQAAHVAVVIDRAQLGKVCAKLLQLLNDDDAEAGDVLDEHSALFRSALGDSYQLIDSAIRNFDFGPALALLKTTVAQLNIET